MYYDHHVGLETWCRFFKQNSTWYTYFRRYFHLYMSFFVGTCKKCNGQQLVIVWCSFFVKIHNKLLLGHKKPNTLLKKNNPHSPPPKKTNKQPNVNISWSMSIYVCIWFKGSFWWRKILGISKKNIGNILQIIVCWCQKKIELSLWILA